MLKTSTLLRGIFFFICFAYTTSTAVHYYGGYCAAYCSYSGYHQTGFHCLSAPDVYCCGDEHYRYCCSNSTLDITHDYRDVYWCDSSWWIFNWRSLTGLVTTTLVLLLCSALCCKCCYNTRGRNDGNDGEIVTISDNVGENGEPLHSHPTVFNPASPYAFTPPDYTSLPKDPPKYHDVYTQQMYGGHVNPVYTADQQSHDLQAGHGEELQATATEGQGQESGDGDGGVPDEPPPSYSEVGEERPLASAAESQAQAAPAP